MDFEYIKKYYELKIRNILKPISIVDFLKASNCI